MADLRKRAAELLERFEASNVLLVAWEPSLQIRLGYPLASNGVSKQQYNPGSLTVGRASFTWSRIVSFGKSVSLPPK